MVFVQLKTVPVTAPENEIKPDGSPTHLVKLVISSTVGVGFTDILKVNGVPSQPAKIGVTLIFAVKIVVPEFMVLKVGKFPFPPEPKPIAILSFSHLKVAPVTFDAKGDAE